MRHCTLTHTLLYRCHCSVLRYWHTDALPRHAAPAPPSAELTNRHTSTTSSSYHDDDDYNDDNDFADNDVVSDVTASTAAAERDALSEAGTGRRGSWLDMLDLRTVLRVDKRDAAAAEAAETSRGVLCHGELSLDHLHKYIVVYSESVNTLNWCQLSSSVRDTVLQGCVLMHCAVLQCCCSFRSV
jgi:hypothetical protein